jgi:hypothetical protein
LTYSKPKSTIMKKAIFVLAIASLSALGSMAQESSKSLQMAGGLRAALPIGTSSNAYIFGIGAEVQGEMMFSEKFAGVASLGYTAFLGKSITVGTNKFDVATAGMIPILVGGRAYLSDRFFAGAKAGYTVSSGKGGGGGFTYEPQVGYNGAKIQISVGYNGVASGGTFSSVGSSLLYKF